MFLNFFSMLSDHINQYITAKWKWDYCYKISCRKFFNYSCFICVLLPYINIVENDAVPTLTQLKSSYQ